MILTFLAAAAVQGPGSLGDIWQHIIADFSNITEPAALAAFGQVLMIDLVLAGDNAIVVDGGKLYNVPLSALYSQADSVTGPLVTKLPKADLSVRAAGAAEAR